MSLLGITLDNSSVAISAKSGTSLSLLPKNYNIDFNFLITFRRRVADFCYFSSPCPCLPKWGSSLCKVKASQELVDLQEESTMLLQGFSCSFAFSPHIQEHMVLSPGLEGKSWPSFRSHTLRVIPGNPLGSSYMFQTNITNKHCSENIFNDWLWVYNDLRNLWTKHLKKWHGAADSCSENAEGKRESIEIMIKWQNFCSLLLFQKAPSAASFQSDQ